VKGNDLANVNINAMYKQQGGGTGRPGDMGLAQAQLGEPSTLLLCKAEQLHCCAVGSDNSSKPGRQCRRLPAAAKKPPAGQDRAAAASPAAAA